MKIRFLRTKHWLLAALLGLMGVATSCAKEYGPPEPDMYGCPPSEYNDSLTKE